MDHDGDVLTANSPEDLILQQLGYELPVSYLEFWIRGLPAPDFKAELTFNELNQLSEISQDGWKIIYPDPRQYGALTLPRRVDVSRHEDAIVLRFIGLNWNVAESLD
jgi:outer membrane lipoprotein LolB